MIADTRASRRARSTAPESWRPYDVARTAHEAGKFAGIGRVIRAEESLVGVDLDHCRNLSTGAITPRARAILEALDSYSEVSPSGTGVKVWIVADLPRARIKPGVEVYPRGRYFTVTGQILTQYSAEVEERAGALGEVIAEEFPEEKKRYSPAAGGRSSGAGRRLDLASFLERWGVDVLGPVGDGEAETKYMVACPWIDEHTVSPETGTFVGQYLNGATFFHCWHSHCAGRTWRDFYRAVAPKRVITVHRPGYTGNLKEVRVNYGKG